MFDVLEENSKFENTKILDVQNVTAISMEETSSTESVAGWTLVNGVIGDNRGAGVPGVVGASA